MPWLMSSVTRGRFAPAQANRSSPRTQSPRGLDPRPPHHIPSIQNLPGIVLRRVVKPSPSPPRSRSSYLPVAHRLISKHKPCPPTHTHTRSWTGSPASHLLTSHLPAKTLQPYPHLLRPASHFATDLAEYPAIAEPTDARGVCASKDRKAGRLGVKTPTRASSRTAGGGRLQRATTT